MLPRPRAVSLFTRRFPAIARVIAPGPVPAAAGCFESIGPGRVANASFSLRPSFSVEDAAAGFTVDAVHIVLARPGAEHAVVDTTIALRPGTESIALSLKVPVLSGEDHLWATVDLLNGGTIIFHGTSEVVVRPGQRQAETPVIVMVYVGPGATARQITVSPRDVSVAAGGTLAFRATIVDARGQSVSSVRVLWETSDASLATITPAGRLSGIGSRGSVTVLARTLTGLRDSVRVTLLPAASRLAV